MGEEKEYVERLEKIIDKQDDLLKHMDAKFEQQQSLNDNLVNQNQILREDIKKHKDLLKDMNKTVTQQKNVVNKLKKELEEQLRIQQDLHKDYGEVIKGLTEELEEEKEKNGSLESEKSEESENSNKVELPPKEDEINYVESATNLFNDIKDKSSEVVNDISKNVTQSIEAANKDDEKCPKCGKPIKEDFTFCESCGAKLN